MKIIFLAIALSLLCVSLVVGSTHSNLSPQEPTTTSCYFDYNNNAQVDELLNQFNQEPNKAEVRKEYASQLKKIREDYQEVNC